MNNIVDRIKKLLRLSKSPNIHEAQLALDRAFEIAAKYQVVWAGFLGSRPASMPIRRDAGGRSLRLEPMKLKKGSFIIDIQVSALMEDGSMANTRPRPWTARRLSGLGTRLSMAPLGEVQSTERTWPWLGTR